jgi:hypothetical protein
MTYVGKVGELVLPITSCLYDLKRFKYFVAELYTDPHYSSAWEAAAYHGVSVK